jgi:hypothetical protein
MEQQLLLWDIYEITTETSAINGIMLRGRIRKFGLEKQINVLAENTEDLKNGVRFAVLSKDDAVLINKYIHQILEQASIHLVQESVANPILSKLKVNLESRYTL